MARLTAAEQQEISEGIEVAKLRADRARADVWTPELVSLALDEAGKCYLAVEVPGTRPSGLRCASLETSDRVADGEATVRARQPTPAEISEMERRMEWPRRFVVNAVRRRIVVLRMLVNPATDRRRHSWRRLGQRCGRDHKTVQDWHGKACAEIAKGLNAEKIAVRIPLRGNDL